MKQLKSSRRVDKEKQLVGQTTDIPFYFSILLNFIDAQVQMESQILKTYVPHSPKKVVKNHSLQC